MRERFLAPALGGAAAVTITVLPGQLVGALGPDIKDDLGFGDTGLGALFTAVFVTSALTTQPGGRYADRAGPQAALRLAVGMCFVGVLAIAALARSYATLFVLLAATQVGNGMSQPASNTLLSRGVAPGRMGIAMGLKQSAIPMATFLSGLAVPVIADTLGWRWAFVITAVLAVPAWLAIPDPPPRAGSRAPGRRRMWGQPHLRLLAIGGGCAAGAVVTLSGFLVTAAEEAGFSGGSAGLLLAFGAVLLMCSRFVLGLVADRFVFDRFGGASIVLASGSVGYLLLATGSKPLIVVGVIVGFGVAWSWPGWFHLGIVERHPDDVGAASGVTQMGLFVGGTIGPLLFGVVSDAFSVDTGWLVSFTLALAGAAFMNLGSRAARVGQP